MFIHSRLSLSILGVVYGLMLGLSGCGKSQPQQLETPTESAVPPETLTTAQPLSSTTKPVLQTQPDTAESETQPNIAALETQPDAGSTPPSPVNAFPLSSQSARLTSRDPDAAINVRSQPTTQSSGAFLWVAE